MSTRPRDMVRRLKGVACMAAASRSVAIPDAAERLADVVEQVARS